MLKISINNIVHIQYGTAKDVKMTTTTWIISGSGLT